MAVARETAFFIESFSGSIASGNVCTVPCTPSFPDSADRAHVIVVGTQDTAGFDSSIASVTVAGVAATLVKLQGLTSGALLAVYKFVQPPRGTHNVVVTLVEPNNSAFVVVNSYEQMDPQDMEGALDFAVGTTGASDTRTLTSSELATSYALQAVGLYGGATNTTVTPVAPFSNTGSAQVGLSPFRFRVGASSLAVPAGGASVSARYNFSTNPKPWAHIAVELKAARLLPLGASMGMGF